LNLYKAHKTIPIISLLLAGLFLFIALNKAFFCHTHIYGNKIVTHSHPYNKSDDADPVKNHRHSDAFLIVISTIEALSFILLSGLILIHFSKSIRFTPLIAPVHARPAILRLSARAPPW